MTDDIDLAELTYGDVEWAVKTTNHGNKRELDDVHVLRWTPGSGIDELLFRGPVSLENKVKVCLWSNTVFDKSSPRSGSWSIEDGCLVVETLHTAYSYEVAVEIVDGLE